MNDTYFGKLMYGTNSEMNETDIMELPTFLKNGNFKNNYLYRKARKNFPN